MIRLIASDLDGTLLQNGAQSLTSETIHAIEDLAVRHHILFVAASGRQYPNLLRLFGSAAKHMAFLCENGAVAFYQDQLLFSRPMNRELACDIIHDILATDGCEVQISGQKTLYLIPKQEEFFHHVRDVVKNEVVRLDCPEDMPEDIYKVSVFEKDGIATHHGPSFEQRWSSLVNTTVSGYGWLDFVDKAVHKGTALSALMKELSIDPSEAAAFGDNYNDIEMLELVGRGYLMENATEALRSRFPLRSHDVLTTITRELL